LKGPLELDSFVVQHNKIPAALAIVSSIYFSTFVSPIQFFLPNSSACCGQWEFWEKNNYFNLLNRLKEKEFIFALRESINGSKVWETRFKPEDFTEIVKRRLSKENAFDKKLNAEAMMKAMIIRMGEMAKPHLNYEIVDYSIRSFFSSLGVKNYLRVDREIKFLRKFEKEMIEILRN